MRLKRKLWVSYIHFFVFLSRLQKLKHTKHINCDIPALEPEKQIDIITVAFNNEYLIEKQIKLIKEFITDEHVSLFIADNSSIPEKRKLIEDICVKHQVGYIQIPNSLTKIFIRKPGYSHGTTLNWLYSNFVKKRKSSIFGFLDHDLFPVSPISIKEKIGTEDFYGHIKDRGKGWYVWAGLCFFKYDVVKELPLDFIPYMIDDTFLDVGGANYPILYSRYNKNTLHFLPTRDINISEGKDYHSDYLQFIDEHWLHMINGSNWKGIPEGTQKLKERMIMEICANSRNHV